MPSQSKVNAAPRDKTKPDAKTQELFDMFLLNGMELIYDENQAKSMLPRLSSGDDPTKVMAELLVDIVSRVTSSASAAGKKIPPEIVLHGGNVLFGEMLKVLEAAGMEPMNEEQKTAVWQMASSIYIDNAVQSGEMTEQELMALSQEVKQTDEGKKVMETAKDPVAAAKAIKRPDDAISTGETDQAMPADSADPAALAAPNQGGM